MARIEARELVAYGMTCDNTGCEVVVPVRNATSTPMGYYIKGMRVTEYGNRWSTGQDCLYFCTKEHMLDALQWQFSALTTTHEGRDKP